MRKSGKPTFIRYNIVLLAALLAGLCPGLLNLFVDPYEVVIDRDRSQQLEELAEKAHYPLWKLGRYRTGRSETVVLGDSRARALREKYWSSLGHGGVINLAYGGGTIPEIYETFRHIRDDQAIRSLVVGIQLRSFDEDHKQGMNRVPEAILLLENPVKYLFNWSIAKTSLELIRQEYPVVGRLIDLPLVTKAAAAPLQDLYLKVPNVDDTLGFLPQKFKRQVMRNGRSDWRGFEVSETYWKYLEEISIWARQRGVRLVFVIPPTITGMQATIHEAALSETNLEMRKRLSRLGKIFDFDYPNPLTADLAGFSDAYHFKASVARQIVAEIAAQISNDPVVQAKSDRRRDQLNCPNAIGTEGFAKGRNCIVWKEPSS